MNKKVILFLALVVCLGICGCESVDNKNATNDQLYQVKRESPKPVSEDPEPVSEDAIDSDEPDVTKSFERLKIDHTNKIIVNKSINRKLDDTKKSFTIRKLKYADKKHYGKLDIKYPVFQGKKDYSKLNKEIVKSIRKFIEQDEKKNKTDVDIHFEVKSASDSIISIFYYGMGNAEISAHPYKIWGTINYNLKDNKLITLNDVTTVDKKFLQILKGLMKSQYEKDIYKAMMWSYDDTDDLLENYKSCDGLFYFKRKKLFIGLTILGAGDYTDFVEVK